MSCDRGSANSQRYPADSRPNLCFDETMDRGETCVTHLNTFTYRQVAATIFLRFRIREAVFLDISMLLMRSFQPFGGARACPDGDSVDIMGGGASR